MLPPSVTFFDGSEIEGKAPAALSCPGISRTLAKNPAPIGGRVFIQPRARIFSLPYSHP